MHIHAIASLLGAKLQLYSFIMKKIVLKVSIVCRKCKVCILCTIAKFEGIVSITLEEEKSTVTVVGDVDAVAIVTALRKAKKVCEIVSVGEADKKIEDTKKALPPCCTTCRTVIICDEPSGCAIFWP